MKQTALKRVDIRLQSPLWGIAASILFVAALLGVLIHFGATDYVLSLLRWFDAQGAWASSKVSSLTGNPKDYNFYSALSHSPSRAAGNTPDLSIYRPRSIPEYGAFRYKALVEGLLQIGSAHSSETNWSDDFEIAWTKMGNKGPLVLFFAWRTNQSVTMGSSAGASITFL